MVKIVPRTSIQGESSPGQLETRVVDYSGPPISPAEKKRSDTEYRKLPGDGVLPARAEMDDCRSAAPRPADGSIVPTGAQDSDRDPWASMAPLTADPGERPVWLLLLGGFRVQVADQTIGVGASASRVFAYLGLHRKPVARQWLAVKLWPDRAASRAAANLRCTIWRMPPQGQQVLVDQGGFLSLRKDVAVDVDELAGRYRLLLGMTKFTDEWTPSEIPDEQPETLLPGWDDAWIVLERQRLSQLRVHSLETIAARLLAADRPAEAMWASQAALTSEPLRESAARLVIQSHLAQGNTGEALQVFAQFARNLRAEVGIEPSKWLQAVVRTSYAE